MFLYIIHVVFFTLGVNIATSCTVFILHFRILVCASQLTIKNYSDDANVIFFIRCSSLCMVYILHPHILFVVRVCHLVVSPLILYLFILYFP